MILLISDDLECLHRYLGNTIEETVAAPEHGLHIGLFSLGVETLDIIHTLLLVSIKVRNHSESNGIVDVETVPCRLEHVVFIDATTNIITGVAIFSQLILICRDGYSVQNMTDADPHLECDIVFFETEHTFETQSIIGRTVIQRPLFPETYHCTASTEPVHIVIIGQFFSKFLLHRVSVTILKLLIV